MESEQQLLYRTRIRASENHRWLQSHRGKVAHAYVPQRPNISRRLDLQADTTVIDLTKPIPEVRVELPPIQECKPRFGKRLLDGMKRGMSHIRERIVSNKRQFVGAIALASAITVGVSASSAEMTPSEPPVAIEQSSPTNLWYESFAATQPDVSYETFVDAVESQEFADMAQWAAENPGADFVLN